ncbi:MAG: alpha/beta hydrolase [Myxococcota bacterium]
MPLYWRSVGTGSPALVCCNGVGVSTFFFKYVTRHFRDRYRVVLWDYRGHGRSAPPPGPVESADLSVERCAEDLATVLRDAGVTEPPILLGHSMGVQVILEYTLRHQHAAGGDAPGVRALIPMFGTFGRPLDTLLDSQMSRPAFDLLHRLARWGGRRGARWILPLYDSPLGYRLGGWTGLLDRHYAGRDDIRRYLDHLAVMDPAVFLRMVSLAAEHDVSDRLPEIDVPVLVFASERDLFTPLHRSLEMARAIPDSELLVLAEASHAAIVEHPDTINLRIERFLRERLGL